jgi:hypothetical protein
MGVKFSYTLKTGFKLSVTWPISNQLKMFGTTTVIDKQLIF